jgi:excinuclease ABC subunit C
VYLFLGEHDRVIYVGKAKNLKNRVSSYFSKTGLGEKTIQLVSQIKKIKTIKVSSEIESLLLEANLIKKYHPHFNIKLTDGKAYPLIRITIKDKYPKVLIARRMDDKNSIYFGPFPNSGALRLVLRSVRKIFPYQSVVNHQDKPCLYNHIGLCPCPEYFKDVNYKHTIKHLIKFLGGDTSAVLMDLQKEREITSKEENYENAIKIQKQIEAIKYITQEFRSPFEYEQNPNLILDIRQQELNSLKEILIKEKYNFKKLRRIECFDISNISGKFTVGSMILFSDAIKDTTGYRKFKILDNKDKPNDIISMKEMLRRRFKRTDWEMPDLIIVDGGKGQVNAVKEVLNAEALQIPVIGLAKREETIITEELKMVVLPRRSNALHLIMRIRDEAHRFAIAYHKKIRGKAMLKT